MVPSENPGTYIPPSLEHFLLFTFDCLACENIGDFESAWYEVKSSPTCTLLSGF